MRPASAYEHVDRAEASITARTTLPVRSVRDVERQPGYPIAVASR
jgi:hypothetical protein